MFDGLLPEPGGLAGLSDAELVSAMTGWAAVESAAAARRLAVIGEFTARRMAEAEHADWLVDDWAAASVEVGAALTMSPGRASGEMDLALTLRNRLPRVAALYALGGLAARTVAMIARRTYMVQDADALAALDAAVAERATKWGPLSAAKLEQAVDLWVVAVDPDAKLRASIGVRDRNFGIGDPNDCDGMTSVWGRLLATDAKLLDARLTAMARAVCEADPRTLAQRRADALGALAAGSDHLACQCGGPACPASADDGRGSRIVVHVLAESTTKPDGAAVLVGGPALAAPQLAEAISRGAQVRPLKTPDAEPEPGYRPSRAQDEWVRMRDLTCRAPGCDRPATAADIDHTIPWPAGVTHPSNTKCYCRFHHLIKTFWPGFTDRQDPDGTLSWTTPTGHTYTTQPLSSVLFPGWDTSTAALPQPPDAAPEQSGRDVMMPKRKRTRAKDLDYRIAVERSANHTENIPPF